MPGDVSDLTLGFHFTPHSCRHALSHQTAPSPGDETTRKRHEEGTDIILVAQMRDDRPAAARPLELDRAVEFWHSRGK